MNRNKVFSVRSKKKVESKTVRRIDYNIKPEGRFVREKWRSQDEVTKGKRRNSQWRGQKNAGSSNTRAFSNSGSQYTRGYCSHFESSHSAIGDREPKSVSAPSPGVFNKVKVRCSKWSISLRNFLGNSLASLWRQFQTVGFYTFKTTVKSDKEDIKNMRREEKKKLRRLAPWWIQTLRGRFEKVFRWFLHWDSWDERACVKIPWNLDGDKRMAIAQLHL